VQRVAIKTNLHKTGKTQAQSGHPKPKKKGETIKKSKGKGPYSENSRLANKYLFFVAIVKYTKFQCSEMDLDSGLCVCLCVSEWL